MPNLRNIPPQQIAELQRFPANIRNICILAHVDHGKTTLADSLVASNGIISQRMAGKMRYMDNWEEEQLRGITMKSSAISLLYQQAEQRYLVNLIDSPGHVDFSSEVSTAVRLCDGALVLVDVVEGVCPQTHAVLRQAWLEQIRPVLVLNKVDRLVLELKLEPQEAYHHLQLILEQMNLITNQLFTSEAMEKVSCEPAEGNGVDSSSEPQSYDWTVLEDENEAKGKNIYFSPDRGNVIFASAMDGWGFSIGQFADMLSAKLGVNREVLRRTLWGDYFYSSKNKRIMKGAQAKGKTPMFVQFVLNNLWAVYDAIMVKKDKEKMEKIVKSLSLTIHPRDSRHTDPRVHLTAITGQWLPISQAVLSVVVELLPSPLQLSEEKVEKLLGSQSRAFHSYPPATQALKSDFLSCSPGADAPAIVFVSKMFPVEAKALPRNKQRPLTEEELQQRREAARARHAEKMMQKEAEKAKSVKVEGEKVEATQNGSAQPVTETHSDAGRPDSAGEAGQTEEAADEDAMAFVAFGRVFSGTVRRGQRLFLLGPKHNPASALSAVGQAGGDGAGDTGDHVQEVTLSSLYLLMGRELENLEEVPAGNILGLGGLEGHILKSGTLSSTLACPSFTDLYFDAHPIVRVAVEPARAFDMPKLVRGLRLLNQADPCVRVLVQETGEHVIVTAGEVHLKRCIDDLQERYAKVEVNPSKPIVPFRETVVPRPRVDMVNESIHTQAPGAKPQYVLEFEDDEEVLSPGLVEMTTPNRKCTIRVRALPLPATVSCLLEDSEELLQALDRAERGDVELNPAVLEQLRELRAKLQDLFKAAGRQWAKAMDQIWSFGPKHRGPNVLLNRVEDYARPSVWACLDSPGGPVGEQLREYDNSVESGFQLATLSGPLCEEPMHGVAFALERWEVTAEAGQPLARQDGEQPAQGDTQAEAEPGEEAKGERTTGAVGGQDVYGPMSGQLMAAMKESCRKAFRSQPQRLMAATYSCTIQATAEVLGKLYGVLGKRHGRILSEDMKEGTQFFNVVAELPVVESFGFAEDIRKKTSGLASPQLRFSHWEIVDIDPFWVPTTEEEYMHFGDKADSENRARKYMNDVRKRKGLKVDEKIVQHAEKQRNLSKNK